MEQKKSAKTYVIFCDESVKKGKNYSNFYGGAILKLKDLEMINRELNNVKAENNIYSEIKMQKLTLNYLAKYRNFLDKFFYFVKRKFVKLRIIFSDNNDLTSDTLQAQNRYSKFYYIFIKHAFGLAVLNKEKPSLRLYFDKLPDSTGQNAEFKQHIWGLQFTRLLRGKIKISKEDIADVDSTKHPILQAIDLITGVIEYFVNEFENDKPLSNRGKAKMEIYKYIREQVNAIQPDNFFGNYFEYLDPRKAWHNKYLRCQFKLIKK